MERDLSGVPKSVLLETGAPVSIISEIYLLENLSYAEIRTISETLHGHDSLRAQLGNSQKSNLQT